MAQLQNISATFAKLVDGNLGLMGSGAGSTGLILGTARTGPTDQLVFANTPADMVSAFGRYGTLSRGWIEMKESGIPRILTFRIGATSAKLRNLTSATRDADGYEIRTSSKGSSIGTDIKIWYDASEDELKIYNGDNELIYHSTAAVVTTNEYEVSVTGTKVTGYTIDINTGQTGTNIGTYLDAVPMAWVAILQAPETATVSANGNVMSAAGIGGSVTTGQYLQLSGTPATNYPHVKVIAYTDNTITVAQTTGASVQWASAGSVTIAYGWDDIVTYIAGINNDDPSKMKLYEVIEDAYKFLEDAEVDIVVPMNVFLDDLNICDGDTVGGDASAASVWLEWSDPTTDDYLALTDYADAAVIFTASSLVTNSLSDSTITASSDSYLYVSTVGGYGVNDIIYLTSATSPGDDGYFKILTVHSDVAPAAYLYLENVLTETTFTWQGTSNANVLTEMLFDYSAKQFDPAGIRGPYALTYGINSHYDTASAASALSATVIGTGSTAKINILTVTPSATNAYGNSNSVTISTDESLFPFGTGSTTETAFRGGGTNTYPGANASNDGLGKLMIEEYQGTNYYFWDVTGNGTANIWPSGEEIGFYGSTDSAWEFCAGRNSIATFRANSNVYDSTNILLKGDFHEVNFAWRLGNYCYNLTLNDNEAWGAIGVLPPSNFDLAGLSNWVGTSPILDGTGAVSSNGTGLLGNRFMAGVSSATITVGTESVARNIGPGFFATTDDNLDGTIDTDQNDQNIDIGAYLDIIAMPVIYFNTFDITGIGYIASAAARHGGFVATLTGASAPTNKNLPGKVTLPFKLNKISKLDPLTGARYVTLNTRANGQVYIEDGPTAARATSDYNRRSTVMVAFEALRRTRAVCEPYRGEGSNSAKMTALQTDINAQLQLMVEDGSLQRGKAIVTQTSAQRVLGQATIELNLVPSFELRQITIYTSLSAE